VAAAAAIAAACAVSFVGGMTARGPQKALEREHVAELAAVRNSEIRTVATATTADASHVRVRRSRTVTRPDGTREHTVTVERRDDTKAATATAAAETRIEYIDRVKLVEREKITERPAPQWSGAITYGRALDGGARYGAELGRRIIGPLWVTLAADVPSRAAMAGLRMEW